MNIGSGPCRDVKEFFDEYPESRLYVHSLDMDESAMRYAEWLLVEHADRVKLIRKNAFRFSTMERYNLVWSAGLFDYLNEKQFIHLLKKLFSFVDNEGELIVGNFSDVNSSRDYMEFAGWYLIHRSRDELLELVGRSGVEATSIEVDQEPEGVNYFLRIRK